MQRLWRRVTRDLLHPIRIRSLLRANLLVLGSLLVSFLLAHFPLNRPNPWLIFPAAISFAGTLDTARCLQLRWSWYHGGVILCVYMDLLAVAMIWFFLLYPYTRWLISSH